MRELAERAVRAGMAAVTQRTRDMDRVADLAIVDVLRSGDPTTPIWGEESGGERSTERGWFVDGVDGTENLVRGSDFVAVTCALLVDGAPVAGATGCPFTGEVWSAERGAGVDFHVGDDGPIALDPEESDAEHLERWNAVRAALPGVEPRAAIALELAHCAAGRFSGVVIVGRSDLQDYAAGALLVEEAGGRISRWPADVVVAGAPATYERLSGFVPRRS